MTLPGFTAKIVETKPDGRRYMVAENESTKVVVSVTLEETKPGTPESSCRQSLEEKTKHPPVKIKDVRFSRSDDLDVMRYTVAEFKGQRVNQESLYACRLYCRGGAVQPGEGTIVSRRGIGDREIWTKPLAACGGRGQAMGFAWIFADSWG